MDKFVITKFIINDKVFYSIYWSNLRQSDKYEIIGSVPSVPGIFELYFLDNKKKLNLFYVSQSWYGGLRNNLREMTDVDIEKDSQRKHILATFSTFYRYSECYSFADMSDIIFFFAKSYFPHSSRFVSSGRYSTIYVKEFSNNKIVEC